MTTTVHSFGPASLVLLGVVLMTQTCHAEWKPHTVRQLDGPDRVRLLPGQKQIVTESWNQVVRCPYLIYMPENDRLLMLVGVGTPLMAMAIFSDDHGATWTEPRYVHENNEGKPDCGMAICATYLGEGKTIFGGGSRWLTSDYGETWSSLAPIEPASDGLPVAGYQWDPYLVDRDPQTGHVTRLAETAWSHYGEPYPKGERQALIRFSTDLGRTWGDEVRPPEWHNVDEVALQRAANGDIVAACRTYLPAWYDGGLDHYEGLATSVSKDNGQTWSALNVLYEYGRHHPCMVLMPDGDMVMSYVVRLGYPEDPEGFPQFGIEAVLSHDNGATWDMDHRFILDRWSGTRIADNDWWSGPQSTSTILMPDGWLLTAYGTGFRCDQPFTNGVLGPHDAGLVRWRPIEAVDAARTAPG